MCAGWTPPVVDIEMGGGGGWAFSLLMLGAGLGYFAGGVRENLISIFTAFPVFALPFLCSHCFSLCLHCLSLSLHCLSLSLHCLSLSLHCLSLCLHWFALANTVHRSQQSAYNRRQHGSRRPWKEELPHRQRWMHLHALVLDGAQFARARTQGRRGSGVQRPAIRYESRRATS